MQKHCERIDSARPSGLLVGYYCCSMLCFPGINYRTRTGTNTHVKSMCRGSARDGNQPSRLAEGMHHRHRRIAPGIRSNANRHQATVITKLFLCSYHMYGKIIPSPFSLAIVNTCEATAISCKAMPQFILTIFSLLASRPFFLPITISPISAYNDGSCG